ncbi:MAG: hypothetical protein PHQ23_10985 [Candidatus Wallbacteria bacterium]|nr:hypothetical protein [Candidatus Wallbacteria bacterium]
MKWIEKPEICEVNNESNGQIVRNCWYRICNKCDGNHCSCNAVAIG